MLKLPPPPFPTRFQADDSDQEAVGDFSVRYERWPEERDGGDGVGEGTAGRARWDIIKTQEEQYIETLGAWCSCSQLLNPCADLPLCSAQSKSCSDSATVLQSLQSRIQILATVLTPCRLRLDLSLDRMLTIAATTLSTAVARTKTRELSARCWTVTRVTTL